jgi:DNA-binding transcriptional MerR regulator
MGTQGEFFERPEIVLATEATEEVLPPPLAEEPVETLPPPQTPANDSAPLLDAVPTERPTAPRRTMKDLSIPKLYYSISEVSRLSGLEPYVLRYWETEFGELHPQKNRAGNRVYSNRDIKFILRIKELLREQRYTIEGAKAILKAERAADGKTTEEAAPSNDPAQIALVSDAKPAPKNAFLSLDEIRSMKQALLDLRAILVK